MDYSDTKKRGSKYNPVGPSLKGVPPRARHVLQSGLILLLLVLGTITVYMTGGTGFAYPYVMLIPVVLAAAWYGLTASILCAALAGLLVGPHMPLNVTEGIAQPFTNWLARLALYVLIGGFTGWLFQRLRQVTQAHLSALKTDSRTGLPNQSALEDDLPELCRRSSPQTPTALVFVRILDLAEILESLGTDASDQVVAKVADQLQDHCPFPVRLYRFSGSELLMLVNLKQSIDLDQVVESIRHAGEQILEIREVPVRVQMAIGSHLSTDPLTPPQELIRRARTALFAAVEESEFYRAYDPIFERRTADRVQLISKVRTGLANREFEMFLQPKVDLATGAPQGAEALIRWHGLDGKIIMPASFMPKVEETSLIAPVTRFVVQQAIDMLRRDVASTIAVNFAVRNLFDNSLIRDLPILLAKAGVDSSRLEIEITEGALIRNPDSARNILEYLRAQGFFVSLDDFGTGYSSFEYLTNLPLSGLKIDLAFVRNIETDQASRSVIKCMTEMAHAMSLQVTAEGIETQRQATILRDLGVDLAQGYYYARPMPAGQFESWLAAQQVSG